jgi:hypothetical protein
MDSDICEASVKLLGTDEKTTRVLGHCCHHSCHAASLPVTTNVGLKLLLARVPNFQVETFHRPTGKQTSK